MIFLSILMEHIIEYLYCCCCFSIVVFMAFNLIQKQHTLCLWHLSFFPSNHQGAWGITLTLDFFFPIIKAKLHLELYMMIIVHFFGKPIINVASSKLNIHNYYWIIKKKKNKNKTYWRRFVEYLADIVICFYLQNTYGKK